MTSLSVLLFPYLHNERVQGHTSVCSFVILNSCSFCIYDHILCLTFPARGERTPNRKICLCKPGLDQYLPRARLSRLKDISDIFQPSPFCAWAPRPEMDLPKVTQLVTGGTRRAAGFLDSQCLLPLLSLSRACLHFFLNVPAFYLSMGLDPFECLDTISLFGDKLEVLQCTQLRAVR